MPPSPHPHCSGPLDLCQSLHTNGSLSVNGTNVGLKAREGPVYLVDNFESRFCPKVPTTVKSYVRGWFRSAVTETIPLLTFLLLSFLQGTVR